MDYKELNEEQKEMIDKVLMNENNVLWDVCRGTNLNLDVNILGNTVFTLLKIKQSGKYETTDEIYPDTMNHKNLLNQIRTTYLRNRK